MPSFSIPEEEMYFPKRADETWLRWWSRNGFNNFYSHFCPRKDTDEKKGILPRPISLERSGKMDKPREFDEALRKYHSEKYANTKPREFYRELREVTDTLGIDQQEFREQFNRLAKKRMRAAAQEAVCRQAWDIFHAMLAKGYWPYDLAK